MKRTVLFNVLMVGLVLTLGATGCKKKQVGITNIPGHKGGIVGNDPLDPGNRLGDNGLNSTDIGTEGRPLSTKPMNTGTQDREALHAETIHFDLDSATIKSSEKGKLDKVADYLKSNSANDVLIEGHCDERGTEGYNLSLGEKRALATREYLASVGAPADHIYTVSFGETKPVAPAQNESAYSQNRRCEFVVVLPAGK